MSAKTNISKNVCPLVSETKVYKEKISKKISALAIMKYKGKDFILIGYSYRYFEIYSNYLESLEVSSEDIEDSINNLGQLGHNTFAVICRKSIFIYLFYSEFDSSTNKDKYHISLIQTIKYISNDGSEISFFGLTFSNAFIFDDNLYKECDKMKNNENKIDNKNENNLYNNELIISGTTGIHILEKKKEKNEDDLENMDIDTYINYCKINKYKMKEQITDVYNYDMVQVNYKFIAGTYEDTLCIYSKQQHELINKYEADVSKNCDSIMYMIKENILCLGGKNTISLISIKDYNIVCTCSINRNYSITEICILPDFNILVAIENKNRYDNTKYLYQYKCLFNTNETTKKMEYKLQFVSQKEIDEEENNIIVKCMSDNKIAIVVNYELIQIWE